MFQHTESDLAELNEQLINIDNEIRIYHDNKLYLNPIDEEDPKEYTNSYIFSKLLEFLCQNYLPKMGIDINVNDVYDNFKYIGEFLFLFRSICHDKFLDSLIVDDQLRDNIKAIIDDKNDEDTLGKVLDLQKINKDEEVLDEDEDTISLDVEIDVLKSITKSNHLFDQYLIDIYNASSDLLIPKSIEEIYFENIEYLSNLKRKTNRILTQMALTDTITRKDMDHLMTYFNRKLVIFSSRFAESEQPILTLILEYIIKDYMESFAPPDIYFIWYYILNDDVTMFEDHPDYRFAYNKIKEDINDTTYLNKLKSRLENITKEEGD